MIFLSAGHLIACSCNEEVQTQKKLPFLLFAGNASKPLAEAIASELKIPLADAAISKFNDGEISITINENVRNRNVYIIQSTCRSETNSVNDNLMELYLTIRALKRASAKSVIAVIPYYGYGRQDRKTKPRVPISASDVAMLIEGAGADRVVAIDLHAGQIQGFFRDIPVDNLYSTTVFLPYFAKLSLQNPVVVSPDAGGVERAKKFREGLARHGVDAGLAIIVKQRAKAGVVESMNLVGDVKGCDVIICDDICDTAGTLVKAAEELKAFGARRVYACITHPVFSQQALQKIAQSQFTEVVISDTIPLLQLIPDNITQLSMAPLLAKAICCVQTGQSIADLFNGDPSKIAAQKQCCYH
jgi:ribose-phosphate pyrophosphokinase